MKLNSPLNKTNLHIKIKSKTQKEGVLKVEPSFRESLI